MKANLKKLFVIGITVMVIVAVSYVLVCALYARHPIAVPEQLIAWYEDNQANFDDKVWLEEHKFFYQSDEECYKSLPMLLGETSDNFIVVSIYNKSNGEKVKMHAYQELLFFSIWDPMYDYSVVAFYDFYTKSNKCVNIQFLCESASKRDDVLKELLTRYF